MFTSRLRAQGRQVAFVFVVMTLAACSSSSGSGPLDATAFGSKLKFADNELSGWTQAASRVGLAAAAQLYCRYAALVSGRLGDIRLNQSSGTPFAVAWAYTRA